MSAKAPARRTLLITILAILAVVAGVLAVIDTLRFLGLLPFYTLGELKFFNTSFFGAILSGLVALIWFSTAAQIWRLDPRGWLFIVTIATLNLIFLVMALIGRSTWEAVALGIVVNAVALIIGLLPSTKAAFGMQQPPAARRS
jgi:hypothetical protein